MSLWFSASAVVPQLAATWSLSDAGRSWLTMSVQLGFVCGALVSALTNLADRLPAARLFALGALAGASFNAGVVLVGDRLPLVVVLRFLTGAALAGVYPPGMKLVATWCRRDRGFGIGLVVGALTLGSALPHLINVLPIGGRDGMPAWRGVLLVASGLAILAALIAARFIKEGPHGVPARGFDPRHAWAALRDPPTRLANLGYLGHMWELYAMWTWVPLFLLEAYARVGWSATFARGAGFAVVGVGAIGAVGAGLLADRYGRIAVTVTSLVVSGLCALTAGWLFTRPGWLTLLCLVWGIAVIADSAQFSAAVTELGDPRYLGTALTVQTCLGFLLTLVTIRGLPWLADLTGWRWAFAVLAVGPLWGVVAMLRLARRPEAVHLAGSR